MASKVEQQYKMLNAELMDQVQKQRIEIGLYKKELVALKHENMELREARLLEIARQREDHIDIVKGLMRQLEIDVKSLADSTNTMEQGTTPFVVNRQSQKRRSSKELCQEMRQSSSLATSTRTISPSRLTHTPPPRRVAELAHYSSTEEEEDQSTTSTLREEPQPLEEQEQRQTNGDLITIVEDSDEETTSSSYTSSPISCDSTIEEYSLPRQVLRSLDPNVPVDGSGMLTRAKCKPMKSLTLGKDHSIEEQPSIQIPRLLVTQASPTLGDSVMSSLSFALEASKSSPRRSMFEGNLRKSGTNTSTPISNKTSPQKNTASRKTSEVSTRTSRTQPKVRIRKLNSEPREAEQTTDFSTTCFNSSGRPSRKCRPTQLSEPSLRVKMRNGSSGKKSK